MTGRDPQPPTDREPTRRPALTALDLLESGGGPVQTTPLKPKRCRSFSTDRDHGDEAEQLTAPGPCALCGRNPALGFASVNDKWYCHGDWQPDPTCYMRAQRFYVAPEQLTISEELDSFDDWMRDPDGPWQSLSVDQDGARENEEPRT